MTTTPTNGVAIEPIVYPLNEGTATRMTVLVLNFETTATTCTTYWQLLTEDGNEQGQIPANPDTLTDGLQPEAEVHEISN